MTLKKGDRLRNRKSRQIYQVAHIKADGTPILYKRNRPRIHNPNLDNWELVPQLEPLTGSKPTAPETVEYHLSGEVT